LSLTRRRCDDECSGARRRRGGRRFRGRSPPLARVQASTRATLLSQARVRQEPHASPGIPAARKARWCFLCFSAQVRWRVCFSCRRTGVRLLPNSCLRLKSCARALDATRLTSSCAVAFTQAAGSCRENDGGLLVDDAFPGIEIKGSGGKGEEEEEEFFLRHGQPSPSRTSGCRARAGGTSSCSAACTSRRRGAPSPTSTRCLAGVYRAGGLWRSSTPRPAAPRAAGRDSGAGPGGDRS